MPEKISILKESGETLTSNVVSVFLIPDTGKRYIITTENAVDPHGLTVLHVSEIVDGMLQKIATDDEWSSIKTIMRAIISGNVGSYQYLPTIENIKASGQYSRDISVSASASKQMIDNYAAADKNAAAAPAGAAGTAPTQPNESPAPVTPSAEVQPMAPQPPIQPSTIFPEANPSVNADEELIPGIAELPSNGNTGSVASVAPIAPVVPEQPQEPAPIAPVSPVPTGNLGGTQEQVVPPIVGVNPVVDSTQQVPPVTMDASVAPVSLEPVAPVLDPNISLGNSVVPNPIEINNNASLMAASPVQASSSVMQPTTVEPVVSNSIAQAPVVESVSSPGVQVVEPTQVVPTAQIAQEVQVPTAPNINMSTTSSFAPNATLDEVVAGAQEMFMEGVKNLVQTIQEKVYRDLYAKEAELKAREELLVQKENMLNNQVMGMGTSVTSTPVATMPSSTVQTTMQPQPSVISPAPVVSGPMIVSADNDK